MTSTQFCRFLVAFLLVAGSPLRANPLSTDNVTARLVAERTAAAPGGTLDLALVLDIRPGWHTYWRNPGDSGEPTRIEWRLPEGVRADSIRWPYPELIRVGPLANYGYSTRAAHLVSLHVPRDWAPGHPLELTAEASWLACAEYCVPESGELTLTIPVETGPARPDLAVSDVFASARGRLPRPAADGARILTAEPGTLRLAVDAEGLPGPVHDAWFFADGWGMIDHAGRQSWRLENGSLLGDLAPGTGGAQTKLSGVLVVTSESGTAAYELSAAVGPSGGKSGAFKAEGGASSRDLGLPLALLLALVGGITLNLMPCVFPVLAMKALSLTRHRGAERRERLANGLAYTAGVLCFFAIVGLVLLLLRAGGTSLGWGYQLQYPPFVAFMAYLFLFLGLTLTGAVTVGAGLMGIGAAGPSVGIGGAFLTGALAALVAAPCTAPFMGAALGYAVTLSWPSALAILLTLGLGLALPYLLFSLFPPTGKILPKPGRWMELFKQALSFPMFATAAWLVWVLSVQTGPSGVAAVLGGMIVLAAGLWGWEQSRTGSRLWRLAGKLLAAGGLSVGLLLGADIGESEPVPATSARVGATGLVAQPFTPEGLESARAKGLSVFVNMTAAWCITCLVNEQVALEGRAVADAFALAGIVYLKGDWTNRDPVITEYLADFGRNGVPIYVYYAPGAEPRVLPQILTERIVLDMIGTGGSATETGDPI